MKRTTRNVAGRGRRWRAAAVAATVGCAAAGAHAESWLQFEAGVGAAHYSAAGDDLWYQEGESHNLHLSAPAWRTGIQINAIDHQPGSWVPGLAFHAVYLNFGEVGMQSLAAPDYDPTVFNNTNGGYYDPTTHSCDKACGPLRNFNSTGRMQAIALTAEPYWTRGNWRFGIEAGPMIFRSTWDASAMSLTANQYTGPAGSVETFSHAPRAELGAIVGVGVSYRNVSVRCDYAFAKSRDYGANDVPVGFKGAHLLTLNYTF